MLRKPIVLFSITLLLWLSSCAVSQDTAADGPTATIVFATPDQSLSTPTAGSVTILQLQGAKGVFLRSRPEHTAAIAGEVQPGDSGKVLGIDSSGTWLLVEIKNQTGWAPIQLLDYTIAQ